MAENRWDFEDNGTDKIWFEKNGRYYYIESQNPGLFLLLRTDSEEPVMEGTEEQVRAKAQDIEDKEGHRPHPSMN